jgi:CRISPR-associated endonuclease/helicase Cas3
MRPSIWPEWMDHIKAKSEQYGGETLAEHTWDVLVKLAELQRLRPNLPALIGVPRLWHCLFWACLLHDFGKAAHGFQARLAGGPKWPQRHEVLSLAFLDWIAPALSGDEQTWVLAAIVSHHRDASYIAKTYPDVAADPLVPLLAEIDDATVAHLWRWLAECATSWRDALGFAPDLVAEIRPVEQHTATTQLRERGVRHIRAWLDRYADWLDTLPYEPTATLTLGVLLRGLTTSADHMASAHLEKMPAPVQESWQIFAERLLAAIRVTTPDANLYTHQCASAAATKGSAILIAPTGSAKTESALFWALGDGAQSVARLFYALPYQASMNAMFDRLRDQRKGFGDEAVGLQHGRAVQAMYARLLESEAWAATAASSSRWQKNINTLNARPIKVFSPYQMLKAMFQLRGFEAMLTDYAQAAFIFDEIHAYEPSRLALILALIKHLREQYGARFFVMSATFPTLIRQRLADALGAHAEITADAAVFTTFQRHRLDLLDGELTTTGTSRIVADVRAGKQVLVCANTVRRAQEVRDALHAAGLRDDELLLIHSRYIFLHRNHRETDIRRLCGMDTPLAGRKPLALIATQVVEVSLNIDLDTIYTDPAPLEALLQRFGRVNRSCKKGICPVHVFRQPDDGQYVYGRHKDASLRGHIVRVTLAELERHNGDTIDESAINRWLDTIYADPQLVAQWETDYNRTAQEAAFVLDSLRPFNSDDQKDEEFERLFDGVEVVPQRFEAQYIAHLMQDEFIEASNYLVSISKQKFAILRKKALVRSAQAEGKRGAWIAALEYDDAAGLIFEASNADADWS